MADVSFKQGEAKTLTITVTDENDAVVDLSSATLFLGVKKRKADADYIFSKDDEDFDKSQVADGIVAVDLSAEDTAQDPWSYVGELKVTFADSSVDKSADLIISIEQAIT